MNFLSVIVVCTCTKADIIDSSNCKTLRCLKCKLEKKKKKTPLLSHFSGKIKNSRASNVFKCVLETPHIIKYFLVFVVVVILNSRRRYPKSQKPIVATRQYTTHQKNNQNSFFRKFCLEINIHLCLKK